MWRLGLLLASQHVFCFDAPVTWKVLVFPLLLQRIFPMNLMYLSGYATLFCVYLIAKGRKTHGTILLSQQRIFRIHQSINGFSKSNSTAPFFVTPKQVPTWRSPTAKNIRTTPSISIFLPVAGPSLSLSIFYKYDCHLDGNKALVTRIGPAQVSIRLTAGIVALVVRPTAMCAQ